MTGTAEGGGGGEMASLGLRMRGHAELPPHPACPLLALRPMPALSTRASVPEHITGQGRLQRDAAMVESARTDPGAGARVPVALPHLARSPAMRELARRIDAWQDRFGRGLAWLVLVMVLVVFGDVLSRYTLTAPTVHPGARVVPLRHHLPPWRRLRDAVGRARAGRRRLLAPVATGEGMVRFVLLCVFFFPSCFLVMYTTWPFFRNSLSVMEGSPDPAASPPGGR